MIEAHPMHLEHEHVSAGLFNDSDFQFVVEAPEGGLTFGCDMTVVGQHPGAASCGLDYELQQAGTDYVIEDAGGGETGPYLFELIKVEFERIKEKWDQDTSRWKGPLWQQFPLRLIVIWEFVSTYYPSSPMGGEEWDTAVSPVDVWDLQSAMKEWAQEWSKKRLAEQQEQENET